jgi:hypothetical protein
MEEAAERRAKRRKEFDAAVTVLELLPAIRLDRPSDAGR